MKAINPYIIAVLIFILAILAVKPWGEHAVNDDWDFYTSTRFYRDGHFTKDPRIDSTFILQPFIGMLWTNIFGLSFLNLRILSIILGLVFLYGVYRLLQYLDTKRGVTLLVLLTIIFNPLFFTSSLSYMTEIYFLAFAIWSLYFFIKYLKQPQNSKFLLISSLFTGLSILIRQFGGVLLIAYFLTLLFQYWKSKKIMFSNFLALAIPSGISYLILYLQPKIPTVTSGAHLSYTPNVTAISEMVLKTPYLIVYLVFFLSPFILGLVTNINKKVLLALGVCAVFIVPLIYSKDIFPIGNIFYIERLYGKSNFIHYLSLFDNIPFKIVISYYVSFLTLISAHLATKNIKTKLRAIKLNEISHVSLLFSLIIFGMFSAVFVSVFLAGDFYDRYFINAFLLLIIGLGLHLSSNKKFKLKHSLIGVSLLAIITIFLATDFYVSESIKWDIGRDFQESRNLRTSFFVNGTYLRYIYSTRFETPYDVIDIPSGLTYECFLNFYTKTESANIIYKILNRFENSRTLNAYVNNPAIYENKMPAGIEPIGWHWNDIFYEKTYKSPIYSILGVKPILGVYCRD